MRSLSTHQQRPEDLQTLSRLLATACLALIITLPILVALYWLWADAGTLAVHSNLSPSAIQGELLSWQRMVGGLLAEIPLVLLLLGVWEARRCFLLFATGQIFTATAVNCLRRFAGWALASAMAAIVAGVVSSVVMTLNNPEGMRYLAVGIGSDQFFLALFAGMVWLMAGVISQGQALAEENATFI